MAHPLTFGVEFEFSLAVLQYPDKDPHPDDPRPTSYGLDHHHPGARLGKVREAVAKTFNDGGVPATADCDYEGTTFWEVSSDPSVYVDNSADPKVRPLYNWYNLEVKSPVLRFCPEALQMVSLACNSLTKNYRIFNPPSAGLHVHIGDGDKGFPLSAIRLLMAFLYVFSPQMDELHSRRDVKFAHSLRVSRVAVEAEEHQRQMMREQLRPSPVRFALKKILLAPTWRRLHDLVASMLHGDSMEYKIWRMDPQKKPLPLTKRTMEWRQAAATLDPGFVLNWIRIVHGLVVFALAGGKEEKIVKMIWEGARRQDENEREICAVDLLVAVGLEEAAEFWRENERFAAGRNWKEERRRRNAAKWEAEDSPA